ncbi:CPBP family glutamic-type intramembrane protease [Pedobacter planticolens]
MRLESRYFQIVVGCVIGPIIETYIFQSLSTKILGLLRINRFYLLILIPSLFFAAAHFYSIIFFLAVFFGGVIINYMYQSYRSSGHYSPFWMTVLLHGLYNAYVFLV